MAPNKSVNWPQRVNIGSSKGLVSTNNKPLTKPMMSQSPVSSDTSNASKFTWQQHKTHIGLIPRLLRSWIYHVINFYPRQHRKSFSQPGRYMWQLSVSTESSRARMWAVYGVNSYYNSYYRMTWYKLTDYRLLLLQGTAKKMIFVGQNIVARLVRPGQTRKSHELWSARYVELTITGESL